MSEGIFIHNGQRVVRHPVSGQLLTVGNTRAGAQLSQREAEAFAARAPAPAPAAAPAVSSGGSSGHHSGGHSAGLTSNGLFPGQEHFNNAAIEEQRRRFDAILERTDPFIQAGVGQLDTLTEGASIQGFDDRIGQIFDTDTFDRIHSEARQEAQGALSAAGLSRSGFAIEELSQLPLDTAVALENSLYGRSDNLARIGLAALSDVNASDRNAANQITGVNTNASNQVGNIQLTRETLANQLALGELGANTSLQVADLNNNSALERLRLQLESREDASRDSALGSLLGAGISAAFRFSDRSLKTDITPISSFGPLTLYQWDWADEVPDFVRSGPRIGFMADEVEKLYPDLVTVKGETKMVAYAEVMRRASWQ